MQKKLSVRPMVITALLISISVVLARFCVIYLTPSIRISFGNIPIMLLGLIYGPVLGGIAGFTADIIGSVFLSALGWYPPLTVSAALIGVIPGLFSKSVKNELTIKKAGIIVLTANVIASMMWSTFWLAELSNVTFMSLAIFRVPLYLGMTAVETIVITALYKAVIKIERGA